MLMSHPLPLLGFRGLYNFQACEWLKTYEKFNFLSVDFMAEDREIWPDWGAFTSTMEHLAPYEPYGVGRFF